MIFLVMLGADLALPRVLGVDARLERRHRGRGAARGAARGARRVAAWAWQSLRSPSLSLAGACSARRARTHARGPPSMRLAQRVAGEREPAAGHFSRARSAESYRRPCIPRALKAGAFRSTKMQVRIKAKGSSKKKIGGFSLVSCWERGAGRGRDGGAGGAGSAPRRCHSAPGASAGEPALPASPSTGLSPRAEGGRARESRAARRTRHAPLCERAGLRGDLGLGCGLVAPCARRAPPWACTTSIRTCGRRSAAGTRTPSSGSATQ